jgi:hypothetical protein
MVSKVSPKTVPFGLVKRTLQAASDDLALALESYVANTRRPDLKLVRLMLDCGAVPSWWETPATQGKLGVIKLYVEYDNPKERDWDSGPQEAFFFACSHGKVAVADFLHKNAKFKMPVENYDLALRYAKERGHKRIVRLLESPAAKTRLSDLWELDRE